MQILKILSVVAFLLYLAGCGSSSRSTVAPLPAPDQDDSISTADAKALITEDVANFNNFNSYGANHVDRQYHNIFSKVFGGTDSNAVKNYFNTRIHYFIGKDELQTAPMRPSNFKYTAWAGGKNEPDGLSPTDDKKAQLGAANVGMALWLMGVINDIAVSMDWQGQTIQFDNARVGLMLIGPGYKRVEKTSQGAAIETPSAYRQRILIHEARHSDCTGGISREDINFARSATSDKQFAEKSKSRNCGHLHVYCPAGHDYAGLPACDKDLYGAYAVGAIYDLASANNLSGRDQQIMRIVLNDDLSRLLYNYSDMFQGKLGDPDMSSSGVKSR